MVILDTNIVIDHLRQKNKEDTLLAKLSKILEKNEIAISIISVQELYEGKSTRDDKAEKEMLLTMSSLKILPYMYEIAVSAGKINREQKIPLSFPDVSIAATAILYNSPLFTLNTKDFQNIKNLKLYK